MSIEPTQAASRCINLNGNHYIYHQSAPILLPYGHKRVESKLLKFNSETGAYEPVSRKYITYFPNGDKDYIREYFPMRDSITNKYSQVGLSPDGKYKYIEIREPGVHLSFYRTDSNFNLSQDSNFNLSHFDIDVKRNLSEFSSFARKHISKSLKGIADGTFTANGNLSKIVSTITGVLNGTVWDIKWYDLLKAVKVIR